MKRAFGVTKTPGQGLEKQFDTAKTVIHAVEIKLVAMVYTDVHGAVSKTKVGVLVGDDLMEDPAGEQWAASLLTLMPWVKEGVMRHLENKKAVESLSEVVAPKEDKVSIIDAPLGSLDELGGYAFTP